MPSPPFAGINSGTLRMAGFAVNMWENFGESQPLGKSHIGEIFPRPTSPATPRRFFIAVKSAQGCTISTPGGVPLPPHLKESLTDPHILCHPETIERKRSDDM